jgi:hypothetical protein
MDDCLFFQVRLLVRKNVLHYQNRYSQQIQLFQLECLQIASSIVFVPKHNPFEKKVFHT